MTIEHLNIDHVSMVFETPAGPFTALDNVDLKIDEGEYVSLICNTVIMITHDVDEAVLLSDRIVMMTNEPAATIGEILDVKLEGPRNRVELADSAEVSL